jgi:hypothetical protein
MSLKPISGVWRGVDLNKQVQCGVSELSRSGEWRLSVYLNSAALRVRCGRMPWHERSFVAFQAYDLGRLPSSAPGSYYKLFTSPALIVMTLHLAENGRSVGVRSCTAVLLTEEKVLRMLLELQRRTCNDFSIIQKSPVRVC